MTEFTAFPDRLHFTPTFDLSKSRGFFNPKDKELLLESKYRFFDTSYTNVKVWVAPTSTRSDGQSIPWIVRPVMGQDILDVDLGPGILHDAYYRWHRGETKASVDRMYLNAMLAVGREKKLGKWHTTRAYLKYCAVKTCGGFAWRSGKD